MIDDIIIGIHDAGLEMVTLHDRPEGSMLGSYYYVIETEDTLGITKEDVEEICEMDGVRFAGCFEAVEKGA